MNFITRYFKKQELGTGQGQIFKDGIKALAFEVYRGVAILHLVQVEEEKLLHYKYLFYISRIGSDGRREDDFHYGIASSLDDSKNKAFKEIDELVD